MRIFQTALYPPLLLIFYDFVPIRYSYSFCTKWILLYCFQDALLALAKAVANATATLVLKAKNVAGKCESAGDKNAVIGSATQCALATSQLVTCTKVVAPTIGNPECQEQLVEAAKQVAKSVEGVVDTSQVITVYN